MSDPVAEAAAQLAAAPGEPVTGNVLVNAAPVVDAPVVEAGTAAVGESAPSSPASTTITTPEPSSAEPLPRESHLMLLEHKLAAMHAKFKTGERIVIDEFEQILGHIKAVL